MYRVRMGGYHPRVSAPADGALRRRSIMPAGHSARRVRSEERIAWLLRTNRRLATDRRYSRLGAFAADFPTGRATGVASSQVSRWETARTPIRVDILRGYETVLGLPRNSLLSVADGLFRHTTTGVGPSHLARRVDAGSRTAWLRVGQLLEQSLSTDVMTGSEWDELTVLINAVDRVFLRGRDWVELANRLLAEQLVSRGQGWRQRHESMHRLLWHADSRPHVIDAIVCLVQDPATQVFVEPLTMLEMVVHPTANTMLLAQLTNPRTDQALRGALLSVITKVRLRHYHPDQLHDVAAAATELLHDRGTSGAARPLAAQLLTAVPKALLGVAVRQLRRTTVLEPGVSHILGRGLMMSEEASRHRVAQLLSQLPKSAEDHPGETLSRLISDITLNPNPDERLQAAQLVGSTPLRSALADALCDELSQPSVAGDAMLTSAILTSLPFLSTPRHREVVEHRVIASDLSLDVAQTAAWTVGHMPGSSTDEFWRQAFERHQRLWQLRRCEPTLSTLRGLVYGLGLTKQRELLDQILNDPTLPADVRCAGEWWRGMPDRIRDSASK
jgi:hypothetical protein